MPKHYVYRIDHDEGFAPNVDFDICTLCGCKKTTVEKWAQEGSWVVGVGGNNTGKRNKLIYAMEVEKVLPFFDFRSRYIRKSAYLRAKHIGPEANVLMSRSSTILEIKQSISRTTFSTSLFADAAANGYRTETLLN